MHSVCRYSLPVRRRSLLKKGTPCDLFWPCPGRKTTTLVRDHEYFIPTKFHQNLSSGSGEEVKNVKSLRRTEGRRTVCYDNSSLKRELKINQPSRKGQGNPIPVSMICNINDSASLVLEMQIMDTQVVFPCPFHNVVIDSIIFTYS